MAAGPPTIRSNRRSRRRRRVIRSLIALFALLVVVCGWFGAYYLVHDHGYYIGTSDGMVVIYKGTSPSLVGIPMSSVAERTAIPVSGAR